MSDVFDTTLDPSTFKYTATSSGVLSGTSALTVRDLGRIREYYAALKSGHDTAYWERVTAGQNFAREDAIDVESYNRELWAGLMGSRPYPTIRTGAKSATRETSHEKLYCVADPDGASHS
jgi:hypothetical protein